MMIENRRKLWNPFIAGQVSFFVGILAIVVLLFSLIRQYELVRFLFRLDNKDKKDKK